MNFSDGSKSIYYLYLAAAVLGLASAIILRYMHFQFLFSSKEYMGLWLSVFYPAYIIISLLVGRQYGVNPIKWACILMFSFYLGALFALPSTGELLPLEMLSIALLCVPCSLAVVIGKKLNKVNV